jgi:hypothetical protein
MNALRRNFSMVVSRAGADAIRFLPNKCSAARRVPRPADRPAETEQARATAKELVPWSVAFRGRLH